MAVDSERAFEATLELALAAAQAGTRLSEIVAELPGIHAAVMNLGGADEPVEAGAAKAEPAVSVRKSLASSSHILSMIDGKPYKTLRRHLATHGMTPDEYRERYGLPSTYPMVAPDYSAARKAMAIKIGLGKKPAA